jgi:hypothetical protein
MAVRIQQLQAPGHILLAYARPTSSISLGIIAVSTFKDNPVIPFGQPDVYKAWLIDAHAMTKGVFQWVTEIIVGPDDKCGLPPKSTLTLQVHRNRRRIKEM